MADITVADRDNGKVIIHASSSIIDQLSEAFTRMVPAVGYDVLRSEDGADLVASRADLDKVLASNPTLQAQFRRDAVENPAAGATKGAKR